MCLWIIPDINTNILSSKKKNAYYFYKVLANDISKVYFMPILSLDVNLLFSKEKKDPNFLCWLKGGRAYRSNSIIAPKMLWQLFCAANHDLQIASEIQTKSHRCRWCWTCRMYSKKTKALVTPENIPNYSETWMTFWRYEYAVYLLFSIKRWAWVNCLRNRRMGRAHAAEQKLYISSRRL